MLLPPGMLFPAGPDIVPKNGTDQVCSFLKSSAKELSSNMPKSADNFNKILFQELFFDPMPAGKWSNNIIS